MLMRSRKFPPLLVASGLVGISLFLIATRYQFPILPASDFARGLWFGVCIGLELLGLAFALKAKVRRAS